MKEVGHHHCGQDGTPAGLHDGQTQDLTRGLGDGNLHGHTGINTLQREEAKPALHALTSRMFWESEKCARSPL